MWSKNMFNVGLKLWSVNQSYVQDAIRLYEQGYCQYIELLAVPDSFEKTIMFWQDLKIPFIIHAPHFNLGINLANTENFEKNMRLAQETLRFANALNAKIIIFHPGANGDLAETIRQLKIINDPRIVIENKPYYGTKGHIVWKDIVCNGYSPDQIERIMQETGVGFCFDIEHAVTAANSVGVDQMGFVRSFLALKPTMFHITDGDWNGIFDQHKHLGAGSIKFDQILGLYPSDCTISIESKHDFQDKLDDFETDVAYLRNIEKTVHEKIQEKIIVRPADILDIHNVFELSNDPIVRNNSFLQEKIVWENHELWFTQKLNDPQTIFYVIKSGCDDFVGYVRFDPEGELKHRISIHLRAHYRGKGLGKTIIEQATELAISHGLTATVYAYIKEENVPSLKSFEKAGYLYAGKTVKHNVPCIVMQYD